MRISKISRTQNRLLMLVGIATIAVIYYFIRSQSRLPYFYDRIASADRDVYGKYFKHSEDYPFAQIKSILLERADENHYKVTVEMFAPIRLYAKERLDIWVEFSTDTPPENRGGHHGVKISFPIGYTTATQSPVHTGEAGALPIKEKNDWNAVACTYDGPRVSAVIPRRFFGGSDRHWSDRFGQAGTTFSDRKGAAYTMDSVQTFRDVIWQVPKGVSFVFPYSEPFRKKAGIEKPTTLPGTILVPGQRN